MAYKVTYVVEGTEGSYPAVGAKDAARLARQHQDAGHVPVKVFDHDGGRVDLHTLELAVRGNTIG